MRTTFISSTTLWNSPRASLDRLQESLVRANTELTTGRHADVGLMLGHKTGETLSLRQHLAELDTIKNSNDSATLRIKSTSSSLSRIRELAEEMRNALVGMPEGNSAVSIVKNLAERQLSTLVADLNTNAAGQYIFGGINTKTKPFNDYSDASSGLDFKTLVKNTFSDPLAGFGFNQDSPLVAGILPDQMKDFLDGPFASLFEDNTTWSVLSTAADQNIQTLVSPRERVETSTNANQTAIRQVAMAYTMIFDLGIESLSEATRDVLVSKAVEALGSGIYGLIELEAKLGTAEERIISANERMDLQKGLLEERVLGFEAIDPAEAKIRVDQIMTQIQTSYSLTAQLRQLSLINFI